MLKYQQNIDAVRYDPMKKLFCVTGWLFYEDGRGYSLEIRVNGEKRECETEQNRREDVLSRWKTAGKSGDIGFQASVKAEQPVSSVELWAADGEVSRLIRKWEGEELEEIFSRGYLRYSLDVVLVRDKKLVIQGWALSLRNEPVRLELEDGSDKKLKPVVKWANRLDVLEFFQSEAKVAKCGFNLSVEIGKQPECLLRLRDSANSLEIPLDLKKIRREMWKYSAAAEFWSDFRKEGFRAAAEQARERRLQKGWRAYEKWYSSHKASPEELKQQRKQKFLNQPKISIIVPLYRTPEKYLREMIRSVQDQTYGNWELCLADGGGEEFSLRESVKKYARGDGRIRYKLLAENLGISGNTNAAFKMAEGEYVGLLDHDDLLVPETLYECVKVLNEKPDTDALYTDEDKVDMKGRQHFDPNFKPDFNQDLLHTQNYICHFFVVKKEIAEKVGGFRSEYDGAQDFDFIFRCTELAGTVRHIPKILYHWRCHKNSTAMNPESKLYAYEAGIRAVTDHYRRLGIPAKAEFGEGWGMYHTKYMYQDQPLISAIIPNRDHVERLNRCMRSLLKTSEYKNLEIIVVENGSKDSETFAYYELIQERYPAVRVVSMEKDMPFSCGAAYNTGAESAKGDFLLFLHSDTWLRNDECLTELLGPCMREDIGCAGGKLLFPDDTIQHAGMIVGLGKEGTAANAFYGYPDYVPGYMMRPAAVQNYSAVSGACMMVRRAVFEKMGGFSGEFPSALQDVDFCLRLGKEGLRVLYTPYAQLYHEEAGTAPFHRDSRLFRERWHEILENGDPYYNMNFTLEKPDFSLR